MILKELQLLKQKQPDQSVIYQIQSWFERRQFLEKMIEKERRSFKT